jgi:8-amino-7-oxononanoate synthase
LFRSLGEVETLDGYHAQVRGRNVRVFCSNNYLGLADDPRVVDAARRAIERWGWGAGSSRLISGTTADHAALERKIASFKGVQGSLLFGSGYLANLAAVRSAAGDGDVIFMDKLCHASLIDAARCSGAEIRVYPHKRYERLERLLSRYASKSRRVIVTDSIFSMDGDVADLVALVEIKKRWNAALIVDEAHATGVLGEFGRGAAEMLGVEDEIDVSVGTLSKALGGIGGFITGGRTLIDFLINTARSFIYTTSLPAAACAAASAAIDIVQSEPERRNRLNELADYFRESIREKLGLDSGDGRTQIASIVLGDPEVATKAADRLLELGFLVPAIRPPTTPPGTSRLRISLTAAMSRMDVDDLVEALGCALEPLRK